jgi:predicted nucleic acid-binding protein
LIVLDASAVVELLLDTAAGEKVAARVQEFQQSLHSPHLLDLEVVQTLRRHGAAGILTPVRAQQALEDLKDLRIRRHDHFHLLDRIWALRNNLTAYDACYLALAESLGALLLTGDAGLASAPTHRVRVELI